MGKVNGNTGDGCIRNVLRNVGMIGKLYIRHCRMGMERLLLRYGASRPAFIRRTIAFLNNSQEE